MYLANNYCFGLLNFLFLFDIVPRMLQHLVLRLNVDAGNNAMSQDDVVPLKVFTR